MSQQSSRNLYRTYMRFDGRRGQFHYMALKPEYVETFKEFVGPGSKFYKKLESQGFNMQSLSVEIRRPSSETLPKD
jgi:hypothetical protein